MLAPITQCRQYMVMPELNYIKQQTSLDEVKISKGEVFFLAYDTLPTKVFSNASFLFTNKNVNYHYIYNSKLKCTSHILELIYDYQKHIRNSCSYWIIINIFLTEAKRTHHSVMLFLD